MQRKLSLTEKTKLKTRHRDERDKRVCDRIKAVLLTDDGYNRSEIARILLLDDETIRRHIEDYFVNHKIAPENGGSESYLTQAQSEDLQAHLREQTYLFVKAICQYVKQSYGKCYSISGMRHWLHTNG